MTFASRTRAFSAPKKPHADQGRCRTGRIPRQLLDVYIPPQGTGPFPVVVWYGGLWKPSKGVPDLNHFFSSQCAAIAVQTRVMQEGVDQKVKAPVSVCLLDARRAVQFVRLHAAEWNIDPQRIAVGGGSQGSLPALYVGCARWMPPILIPAIRWIASRRKLSASPLIEASPASIRSAVREWVPGVEWGVPALGYSFAESLKRHDELQPLISQWSPEALLKEGDPPIYFEYNWGLTKPNDIQQANYLVHSPAWGLGFKSSPRNITSPVTLSSPIILRKNMRTSGISSWRNSEPSQGNRSQSCQSLDQMFHRVSGPARAISLPMGVLGLICAGLRQHHREAGRST